MSIKSCSVCSAESTQVCGRCKEVRYCSPKCQRAAWATHKLVCNKKIAEHEGKKGIKTIIKGESSVELLQDMQNIQKGVERGYLSLTRESAQAFAQLAKKQEESLSKHIQSLENRISKLTTEK